MNPECPICYRKMIRVKDTNKIMFKCPKSRCNNINYQLCFICVDEGKSGLFPKKEVTRCQKCDEYFCDNHITEYENDTDCNWTDYYCNKCKK